ncbi:MAG: hypothetical protein AAF282_06650 [Cyanobacteria bacterium P01_A01_bin.15]
MDTSMIIGLTLAGSIVMLSGGKRSETKVDEPRTDGTEFIVRVDDDGVISFGAKDSSDR